jgi:basic membrane lipoprotein Med (substrate-binding protein (PBP1-ABC) superfamily)
LQSSIRDAAAIGGGQAVVHHRKRVGEIATALSGLALAALVVAPGAAAQASPEPSEPGSGESGENVTVAFVYVSPAQDGGFYSAFEQARLALEETYPNVDTVVVESVPESAEAQRTFEQLIADGADMIIAGTEYADFLYEVADAHPEVKFLELHGHRTTDNTATFYLKAWDAHYLYGVAAGLLSETGRLGYIGSFPIPDVYTGVNAFTLGARSVNPEAVTQTVVVNSWFDPPADTQAANALMDGGADYIYGITIPTAYLQVAEERDGWAAGWWSLSQREFGPEAYVGSIIQDWTPFFTAEVGKLLDGTWTGNRHEWITLGEGFDIDAWGDNIPADVQAEVNARRAQIIDGSLNVFEGPIVGASGEVLVEEGVVPDDYDDLYLWDKGIVEGVSGLD